MRLSELIEQLCAIANKDPDRDPRAVIRVYHRATFGASPCDEIKGVSAGIDWDSGIVFIDPVKPPVDELRAMREAVIEAQTKVNPLARITTRRKRQ